MDPAVRPSPSLPRRSTAWLAVLVGVAAVGATLARCSEPAEVSSPTLAWDGEGYAIAWPVAERSGGVAVHARRLPPGGGAGELTATADDDPIFRTRELSGSPEIVAGNGGFVVVVLPHDHVPRAIPLDRGGSPAGPAHELPGCSDGRHLCLDLCRGAVAAGDGYAVAYLASNWPLRSVHLALLDREGRPRGDDTMVGFGMDWVGCAVAAAEDRLAVAWLDLDSAAGAGRIGISFRSARDGSAIGEDVWVRGVSNGPLVVVPHAGEWAVLYQDVVERRLRVATVSADRGVRESIALPLDVDPASADLGANRRGLFVTWLGGGKTHIAGVGGGAHRTERSRSTPVGTRALGHDDRCTATWSESAGRRVRVATARPCP